MTLPAHEMLGRDFLQWLAKNGDADGLSRPE